MRRIQAFTTVELVVALAIIGLLSSAVFISYRRAGSDKYLASSAAIFSDALNEARIYSREARGLKTWGIRNNGSSEYELVSYAANPSNVTVEKKFMLGQGVVFEGDVEVWFAKTTGETDEAQFIITHSGTNKSVQISISSLGAVEIENL